MPTPVNSAGHTPGPWIADGFAIVTKGVKSIGFIYGPSFPERSDLGRRALADARLAAAAPDLLEIVRISIGNVRSLGPAGALGDAPFMPYREWLAALEAVYARATGETQ